MSLLRRVDTKVGVTLIVLLTQLVAACESNGSQAATPSVTLEVPQPVPHSLVVPHAEKSAQPIPIRRPLPQLAVLWRRDGSENDTILMVPRIHAVSDRSVIIVDAARQAIVLLDLKNGSVQREFGRRGHGPGELADAARMAVVSQSRIAIFDRENGAIKSYSTDGALLSEHAAGISSISSACALSGTAVLIALLGKDDIAHYAADGTMSVAFHRVWPDQEETEALLRSPILVQNRASGSCLAIQPYGGRIAELSANGVIRRAILYRDDRPLKIQRRGDRNKGTENRVIRGQPTIEDACVSDGHLLLLRATSDSSKVLDVFGIHAFEFLGSLPINRQTITIGCSTNVIVAKEYSDGLLHFVAYAKVTR